MKWESCKDNPPKITECYILCYKYNEEKCWDVALYNVEKERWENEDLIPYGDNGWYLSDCIPYKWSKIKLPE